MKQDLPSCVVFRIASNLEFDFSSMSSARADAGPCPHDLANGIRYGVWNPGLLIVDFQNCPDLVGGAVPNSNISGIVPEPVRLAEEHRLTLSLRRVRLANALALCVTSALERANSDSPFVQDVLCNAFEMGAAKLTSKGVVIHAPDLELLTHNTACDAAKGGASSKRRVAIANADKSIELASHLIELERQNEDFDALALTSLARHARVLHRQQSADASLAISWTVAEQLIERAFYVFGVAKSSKVWPAKASGAPQLSKSKFKDMWVGQRIQFLDNHKLITSYLASRVDAIRRQRNSLLHGGAVVSPTDSGTALTAVRDLFVEVLDLRVITETSWSYRT